MGTVTDIRVYTDIDLSKQRLADPFAYRRENSELSFSFKDLFICPCPQFSGPCNDRKQLLYLEHQTTKGTYLNLLLLKLFISGTM